MSRVTCNFYKIQCTGDFLLTLLFLFIEMLASIYLSHFQYLSAASLARVAVIADVGNGSFFVAQGANILEIFTHFLSYQKHSILDP